MPEHPPKNQPVKLDYCPGDPPSTPTEKAARVFAAVDSVLLLAIVVYTWLRVDQWRPKLATLLEGFLLVPLAGSVFFLLLAVGIIGKRGGGSR